MQVLRTFARIYTTDLDATLRTFRTAGFTDLGACRFDVSHLGVEVCIVGDTVVVAGSEDTVRDLRTTDTTWVVDDLESAISDLAVEGAVVVRPPAPAPTGRNATVRVGGMQIELVQWMDSEPLM